MVVKSASMIVSSLETCIGQRMCVLRNLSPSCCSHSLLSPWIREIRIVKAAHAQENSSLPPREWKIGDLSMRPRSRGLAFARQQQRAILTSFVPKPRRNPVLLSSETCAVLRVCSCAGISFGLGSAELAIPPQFHHPKFKSLKPS